MLPKLFHAVGELPDDAFSGDIVHIRLCICGICEFHPVASRPFPEPRICFRCPDHDRIPGLRLDFKAHAPFRIFFQQTGKVVRVAVYRIMSVDAAMETVYKVYSFSAAPVLGKGRRDGRQKHHERKDRFHGFRYVAG